MSEKISSLFDNEIDQDNINKEIDNLSSRSTHKVKWKNYQVVRDVLQNNFTSTPDLTDKIMEAINKEPTQISGYIHKSSDIVLAESTYKHWKIAASFAAFFVVGFSAVNYNNMQQNKVVQLVQEDVSEDIIARHYANTSLNAGYFIQANFSQKD